MDLLPCPQREDCPNNNVLLVDANVIANLVKIQLLEPIDHNYRLVEHFNNFLTRHRSLLERIFNCSIDGKIYVTRKIFKEIDMKNDRAPFRREGEFRTLRTICENRDDYEKMNELHCSIFSIEEIDENDLRELKENLQNEPKIPSDEDLSLAILALKKTLEINRDSVIITDDEDFISTLKKLRDKEPIDLTFGRADCSKLAYRRLTGYIAEIYSCCKMEKDEYEPIHLGLFSIQHRRTDMAPQKKNLKRRVFKASAAMFDKTTKRKYPHLAESEFQP